MPVKEFRTHKLLDYDEDGNELWGNENAVLLSWSNSDNQDSDGDSLTDGEELQITTRFDGHTYVKMYSNPCLEDSDGDGLLDGDDPISLIPFMENYVFYDPNLHGMGTGFQYAIKLKEELDDYYSNGKSRTRLVPVTDADVFVTEWKAMGSDGAPSQKGVILLFHGNPYRFAFSHQAPNIETTSISALDIIYGELGAQKEMDVLLTLACSQGNDMPIGLNVAEALTMTNSANYVVASDEFASTPLTEDSIKLVTSRESWSWLSGWLPEIKGYVDTHGFEVYTREHLVYFNEPLGVIGRGPFSVTEILDAAKGV